MKIISEKTAALRAMNTLNVKKIGALANDGLTKLAKNGKRLNLPNDEIEKLQRGYLTGLIAFLFKGSGMPKDIQVLILEKVKTIIS